MQRHCERLLNKHHGYIIVYNKCQIFFIHDGKMNTSQNCPIKASKRVLKYKFYLSNYSRYNIIYTKIWALYHLNKRVWRRVSLHEYKCSK